MKPRVRVPDTSPAALSLLEKAGPEGPARSAALFQLATELPAAVLVRMLGIHNAVARCLAARLRQGLITYAADVRRRTAKESRP